MDFLHARPEDIVGTIRALLTGDCAVDFSFVKQQKENYAAHAEAEAILPQLDRILAEIRARVQFEVIRLEQRRRCDSLMRDASAAVAEGDLQRAERILLTLVEHDTNVSDWSVAFYDFQDPIERLYVEASGDERREIRETAVPLVGVYQMLCAVELQLDRVDEALHAIDAAINLNRAAVMPRIERTYCLQRLGRWDELWRDLSEAFPLCYTQMHFGQWYRSLAPWFFHAQDFVGFGACLQLSLACVEDDSVRQLLQAAEPLSETPFDDTFVAEVPQAARERGIPLQPASVWYDLAMQLARQTLEDEAFERALRYLTIAYDLRRSPELFAQIERLRDHLATLGELQDGDADAHL